MNFFPPMRFFWLNVDQDTMAWRKALPMNEDRRFFAAVVCHGALYAIGGQYSEYIGAGYDTIERIDIDDLFCPSCMDNETKQWMTLECRLSSGRGGCAAVAVQDRFIVVAGGNPGTSLASVVGGNPGMTSLAPVDILDTQSSESQCVIISRPSLNAARRNFGMGVVGQRVFVVGGMGGEELEYMNSVEYLEFDDWSKNEGTQNATATSPFTNKSWKFHKDLVLGTSRHSHGVVRVGSCLIVVGGEGAEDMRSVEVLDTQRNLVWQLPEQGIGPRHHSAVAISKGIATISCWRSGDAIETLPLVDKNSACFARMIALEKAPLRIEHCSWHKIKSSISFFSSLFYRRYFWFGSRPTKRCVSHSLRLSTLYERKR